MARRKDESLGGRWLAGEDGSLFVLTDGVSPVFDWQAEETYPSVDLAAAAWERVRIRTWKHEQHEGPFPPAGAVYDGLVSRTNACGSAGDRKRVLAAVDADLLAVELFRQERPDAAESIANSLAAYENALHLIAGAFTPESTQDERRVMWQKITKGVAYGEAA